MEPTHVFEAPHLIAPVFVLVSAFVLAVPIFVVISSPAFVFVATIAVAVLSRQVISA